MSLVLTSLVIVAMLATIATLVMGLWSMVYDTDVGALDSEHWMIYRVVLQGVALAALVATFFIGK